MRSHLKAMPRDGITLEMQVGSRSMDARNCVRIFAHLCAVAVEALDQHAEIHLSRMQSAVYRPIQVSGHLSNGVMS